MVGRCRLGPGCPQHDLHSPATPTRARPIDVGSRWRPSHGPTTRSAGAAGTMGPVTGRPIDRRPRADVAWRTALAALVISVGTLAGCSRDESAVPPTVDEREAAATLSTNPFIPEDVNIGDCVSALPRPGCGNEIRGDSHAMLTFGVLMAGLAFIGWRIARSVRRRDGGPVRPSADRPRTS